MSPKNQHTSIYDRVQPNSVEFTSLLSRCLRQWYIFLIFGATAFSVAWLYLQYQEPVYTVSSKIIIQEDEKSDLVSGQLFGSNTSLFGDNLTINNETEVLKSRRLFKKIVDDLDLNIRYYAVRKFVDMEVYPDAPIRINFLDSVKNFYNAELRLSQTTGSGYTAIISAYDASEGSYVTQDTISVNYGAVASYRESRFRIVKNREFSGEWIIKVMDPLTLAISLSARLSVESVPQSEVLILSHSDNLPGRSAQVLNKLIEVYNKQVLDNKNLSTKNTIDFIDERLRLITQELGDVETELEEFKRNNDVPLELSQNAEQFLERASSTNERINELELQMALLRGMQKDISTDSSELLSYDFSVNGQVPFAITEFNRLVQQRSTLMVSATPSNPRVIALDGQIASAKQNLKAWVDNKLQDLISTRDFLLEKRDPLSQRIKSIPRFEREMLQIIRQQAIKEQLFTFLLQKREESALKLASEVNNARIINDPIFTRKVSPDKTRTYVIFLVLGLGIPLIALTLIEYFDNYIHSKDEITSSVDVSFLGEVPYREKQLNFENQRNNKSVVSEMFRMIRTNLRYLNGGEAVKTILVTSTIGGEGKTFVAANLAVSMAFSGKKVVVLGFDLRKPKIKEYFPLQSSVGLSNFLINQEDNLDNIVSKHESIENLSYIDCGPIPPNPYELIMGPRTKELFDRLKNTFEVIIVDSAPVGLVADAFGLSEHVDSTIYVTRFGHTSREQLNVLSEIVENKKLTNVALLFNGVKKRIGYAYGRYAYSYGSGYYEESNRIDLKSRLKRK